VLIAFLATGFSSHAIEADVVVYGGTSAAVTAAVQAKKMGKSVVVVSPDRHLGGLSSGGLGWTDSGRTEAVGGLSREFYQRIWKHYQQPEAWKWQKRETYGNRGQGSKALNDKDQTAWAFEPHVAEQVFEDFIAEYDIPVHRDEWLDRESGVEMKGGRIVAITTLSGKTYRGKIFIDAAYEGDLMAAAGVSYFVGREANSVYGEKWNGIQANPPERVHQFEGLKVSPYIVPGDPASGLVARVSPEPPGINGEGDKRIQAYCFRLCMTTHPDNLVPIEKPEGYDPAQYEIFARVFEAGWNPKLAFRKFDPLPNRKTDKNNYGSFSTDNIGMNYDYPEASYERRREIIKEHETYQRGLFYFMANNPRVPEEVRDGMTRWGLAKDEFTDNGNWPHQLYIREARRMVGEYVMTEHDMLKTRVTPQSVGMGAYPMDSHNTQRYINEDGFLENEGNLFVRTQGPYKIAYGSLIPKKGECSNLLTPTCPSSSHIAFGSIRMEPVFMILGQSAATAACLAIDSGVAVQDVEYDALKKQLLADGQRLTWKGRK
jgi:hypothetical protein